MHRWLTQARLDAAKCKVGLTDTERELVQMRSDIRRLRRDQEILAGDPIRFLPGPI